MLSDWKHWLILAVLLEVVIPLDAPTAQAGIFRERVTYWNGNTRVTVRAPRTRPWGYSATPAYVAPAYGTPVYSAPVYSAPMSGAPATGAPAYNAPIQPIPETSVPNYTVPTPTQSYVPATPVRTMPSQTYVAPVRTYVTPTYVAPVAAPVYQTQIQTTPVYRTYSYSVAPATTIYQGPVYTPAFAPAISAAPIK